MTLTRHYTGHFKAVVTKPQNVMVMRDIACAGYVAGCNTRWFAGTPGGMNKGLAQENIQDRLSFADDVSDRYASMLAFPAHEGQFTSGQLDTVMSVTGRLLPWEVNGASTLTHESFPGGEAMYKQYQSILGLGSVHYGEDMKAAENMDFISQVLQLSNHPFPNPMLNCRFARRAQRTMPRASSAPTASTTPSPSPSCRSSPARATLAPTPSLG